MSSNNKDQRPLSSKKRAYLLAYLGGFFGGPIGSLVSPFVLYGVKRTMKEKDGKKPNIFKRWALIGIVAAPLCWLPLNLLRETDMSVVNPLNTKAEEGCSNYPFKPFESKFIPLKDGGFRLFITADGNLLSNDYKGIGLASFEAEQWAEYSIKAFLANNIVDEKVVDEKDLDIDQILSQKVYGIIKVGSCYEPNKYVRVTLGISPKTISAHKEVSPYLLDKTRLDKDLLDLFLDD